jgi:hypothetical protein
LIDNYKKLKTDAAGPIEMSCCYEHSPWRYIWMPQYSLVRHFHSTGQKAIAFGEEAESKADQSTANERLEYFIYRLTHLKGTLQNNKLKIGLFKSADIDSKVSKGSSTTSDQRGTRDESVQAGLHIVFKVPPPQLRGSA